MNKFKTFIKLRFKVKVFFIVTFLLTGIFRALILVLSFKKVAKLMGEEGECAQTRPKESELRYLSLVKWSVYTVSKYTPWESLCLVQALTAQMLLKLKKINHTIFLGLSRIDGELKAHAWIKSGDYFITGEAGSDEFSIINKYGYIKK